MKNRTRISRLLAAALAAWPSVARGYDFHEPFLWKGNHAATFDNATSTSVFWNEDDWDVRTDTHWKPLNTADDYTDIQKASTSLTEGTPTNGFYVVGGDGSAGVGIMRLTYDGQVTARLRNPMLISAGTPGVVEFRAPLLATSGHWWEVAIAPADGPVIAGEVTSLPPEPGSSGFYPAEDSLNFILHGRMEGEGEGGVSDFPCNDPKGYGMFTHVRRSIGPAQKGADGMYHKDDPSLQQNYQNFTGVFVPSDPTKPDELHAWRLKFYPDRVEAEVDLNNDGILEPHKTFMSSIPWSEVYVYLLGVAYEAGHHPGAPCYLGNTREFRWKDVRVSPVKYGRTACWPKNQGTNHVPKTTGMTRYDTRDVKRGGAPVNGIPQPNDGGVPPRAGGVISNISGTNAQTRTVNLPDVSGLARAQFVYDISGPEDYGAAAESRDGTASLRVNGTSVGVLPDRRSVRIPSSIDYNQRSINVPVNLLNAGPNTVEITMTGDVKLDRMHFELSYTNPASGSAPSAPGAASALAAGPQRVEVSWSDNSGNEDGFVVERSVNGGAYHRVATTGAGVTSYVDREARASSQHTYRVYAFNRFGSSAAGSASNPAVTPALPGTVPAAPSNLVGQAFSPFQAQLTWTDNSSNEDGFIILGTSNGGAFPMYRVGPDVTSFDLIGKVWGGYSYGFRVRAYNAHGESADSNQGSVSMPNEIPDGTPVAAPTNLVAGALAYNQVQLTWTDNANNETGYAVERAQGTNGFFEVGGAIQVNLQSFQDGDLQPSTTYRYRVRAFTKAGTWAPPMSGYSNEATVTTPPLSTTLPVNPDGLQASLASPTQINVTWNDNANNETGFHLERSVNGGEFLLLTALGAGVESYSDTGLPAGLALAYRVRAYNGAGTSAWSNVSGAMTPGGTPPPGGNPGSGTGPISNAAYFLEQRVLTPGMRDGRNDTVLFDPSASEVTILDARGREVSGLRTPYATWDGKDVKGRAVAAGLYVARVKGSDGSVYYQRILIVK